jgi:hypothetical protein
MSAERAFNGFHSDTPRNLKAKLRIPPTRKAKGKMNATIARAVFSPLSFMIMKKLATQGTKSVIVTRLTTI